jgi:hypothetical protein
MDAEQSIAEIEWLERIFAVPDARPLSASDLLGGWPTLSGSHNKPGCPILRVLCEGWEGRNMELEKNWSALGDDFRTCEVIDK